MFQAEPLVRGVDFIACCGVDPFVQWTVMHNVYRNEASGRSWLAATMG